MMRYAMDRDHLDYLSWIRSMPTATVNRPAALVTRRTALAAVATGYLPTEDRETAVAFTTAEQDALRWLRAEVRCGARNETDAYPTGLDPKRLRFVRDFLLARLRAEEQRG